MSSIYYFDCNLALVAGSCLCQDFIGVDKVGRGTKPLATFY